MSDDTHERGMKARREELGDEQVDEAISRTTEFTGDFQVTITPVLNVRDAAEAASFYERAFGAAEVTRSTGRDGKIVVEMSIAGARLRVADEALEAFNPSPESLHGTSVRINLLVPDPDAIAERAIKAGATEVTKVADQSFGLRQGRLADPFGHHWLVGRPLEGDAGDWARG